MIASVAAGLDRERFDVHLAAVSEDAPGATEMPQWVTVHRLYAGRVRWSAIRVVRLLWKVRPELVIPGMMHLSALLLALKPILPRDLRIAPRVNTTLSRSMTGAGGRLIFRWLMRRANSILCQSDAMAEDTSQYLDISWKRILVAPNPVTVDAIRRRAVEAREQAWVQDQVVRVIYAGRLAHEKGVDMLLKAWAQLHVTSGQAQLTIIGEGAEHERLNDLRVKLQVETTVALVGFQADVASWMGCADVLVQPSRWEGMPNALLEGAAAGLLLVTTPSSEGVVRLLQDAPWTWITHDASADALAEALRMAITTVRKRQWQRVWHNFLESMDSPVALQRWNACVIEMLDGASAKERQA